MDLPPLLFFVLLRGVSLVSGGEAAPYEIVGFDRLASFEYVPAEVDPAKPDVPPPGGTKQIPEKIRMGVIFMTLSPQAEGGDVVEKRKMLRR